MAHHWKSKRRPRQSPLEKMRDEAAEAARIYYDERGAWPQTFAQLLARSKPFAAHFNHMLTRPRPLPYMQAAIAIEDGIAMAQRAARNPRRRHNPYGESPEPGWSMEEYTQAVALAHKRAALARARLDEEDKVKRIARWSHFGTRYPIKVIAEKKVAGMQVQLGRHAEPSAEWYAIRVPNLASGWFLAIRTRASAKSAYRKLTTKAKIQSWFFRHAP
jgi:hypothetical protein